MLSHCLLNILFISIKSLSGSWHLRLQSCLHAFPKLNAPVAAPRSRFSSGTARGSTRVLSLSRWMRPWCSSKFTSSRSRASRQLGVIRGCCQLSRLVPSNLVDQARRSPASQMLVAHKTLQAGWTPGEEVWTLARSCGKRPVPCRAQGVNYRWKLAIQAVPAWKREAQEAW